MTPDDMEDLKKWADGYGLMNTDRLAESVRALLLDYQERGRALERVTDLLASANRSTDRPSDYVSRAVMEARATLKGKSHE
jgi:hypothetical protein